MFRFLYELPGSIYWGPLIVLLVLAWLRGGKWERLAAVALVLGAAIGIFLQRQEDWFGPQYGVLALDTVLFFLFVAMALHSRLWWATWAAGFMLFSIAIHVAMIIDERVESYAYYLMSNLSAYLVVGAVMVGAWTHKRE